MRRAALALPPLKSRSQRRISRSKPSSLRTGCTTSAPSRKLTMASTKPVASISRISGTKRTTPCAVAAPAVTRSSTSCGACGASSWNSATPSITFSCTPGVARSASRWPGPLSSVLAPGNSTRPPLCSMVAKCSPRSGCPSAPSRLTRTVVAVWPSAGRSLAATSTTRLSMARSAMPSARGGASVLAGDCGNKDWPSPSTGVKRCGAAANRGPLSRARVMPMAKA